MCGLDILVLAALAACVARPRQDEREAFYEAERRHYRSCSPEGDSFSSKEKPKRHSSRNEKGGATPRYQSYKPYLPLKKAAPPPMTAPMPTLVPVHVGQMGSKPSPDDFRTTPAEMSFLPKQQQQQPPPSELSGDGHSVYQGPPFGFPRVRTTSFNQYPPSELQGTQPSPSEVPDAYSMKGNPLSGPRPAAPETTHAPGPDPTRFTTSEHVIPPSSSLSSSSPPPVRQPPQSTLRFYNVSQSTSKPSSPH